MSAIRVATVAVVLLGLTYCWGRLQPVIQTAELPGSQTVLDATEPISNGMARIIFNITGLGSGGVETPKRNTH